MKKNADIVVAGGGMAGLSAAVCAARAGASVILLRAGAGALSIGSGCVDILGYAGGLPVTGNPLEAFPLLPDNHPYRIAGREAAQAAVDFFLSLCREADWPFASAENGNHLLPTVMGTLKPTGLCPPSADPGALSAAGAVGVVGFEDMRDCRPAFIASELARRPFFAGKRLTPILLPPARPGRRSANALDLARMLDTEQGLNALITELHGRISGEETLLLPPVCGTRPDGRVWRRLRDALGRGVVEMIGMPPGVGGLRLQELFLRQLRERGVTIEENARAVSAETQGKRCLALHTREGNRLAGEVFILATGGFLGGGITASPGRAREMLLNLPVRLPENPDRWSEAEIFGDHAFARAGLSVNSRLVPTDDDGEEIYSNVRAAGRILAGCDFAGEKSGNGVALVTGHLAALSAVGAA